MRNVGTFKRRIEVATSITDVNVNAFHIVSGIRSFPNIANLVGEHLGP